MDAVTKLRDALLEHELITARERDKVSIALYLGDVRRHRSKLSRRFTISIGGTIRFVAKFIPSTWSYKPEDIVSTIDTYSRCTVFSVPKLLAHFRSNDGYYFIEEYLKDPVSLADLIERGEMSPRQGLELLRKVFTDIAQTGTIASPEFVWSEQRRMMEYLEYFIERGIVGDAMLNYIGQTIQKHSASLKEVWSSGDIIDRNLLRSEGKWYLTDYEYSHRTIFLFKEAYRNIQYCPWAKDIALHEIFLPLGQFPEDVARIIALAWDNHLQRDLLDTVAREQTSGHLRHLFWNVIDPALLERLDRKLSIKQQEAAELAATAEDRRKRLETAQEEQRQTHASLVEKEEYIASLEATIVSRMAELSALHDENAHQKYIIKAGEQRIADLLRQFTDKLEQIKQLQATLLQFQRTVEEKGREIDLLRSSLQSEQLDARRKEEDRQREVRLLLDSVDRARKEAEQAREDFTGKLDDLDTKLASRETRIQELVNYSESLQHQLRVKEEAISAKATHVSELERQVAQKNAEVQQKIADYIYIKSTLSYSIGRIITLPFALLFDGVMKLVAAIDKSSGHVFWPKGTRRYMIVNALMNLRQTVATGTYLLRMHGPGGLWNGIRQTWGAGNNLALYKNFVAPAPPIPPASRPVTQIKQEEVVGSEYSVSVVIPVLNEERNLGVLLPALFNQRGFKGIEIIVVDSGSKDGSVSIAYEYGAKVVEIPPSKFSHSYARNLGAEHASHELLLLMTADALPSSNYWLYKMQLALQQHKVAAVSCRELPRGDVDLFSRVQLWYHYDRFLGLNGNDKVLGLPVEQDSLSLRKHAQLSDVACLMKRETYSQYKFRYEYGEDLDLGIRLVRDGKKIALLGSTSVIHSHRRPPYYHVKRGFMDKLVLSRMLNEQPPGHLQSVSELLHDVLQGYQAMISISPLELLCRKEVLSYAEFRSNLEEKANQLLQSDIPFTESVTPDSDVDIQFHKFMQNIAQLYFTGKKIENTSRVILQSQVYFVNTMLEYMKGNYELIDLLIAKDVRASLLKSLANQIGVQIAVHNLSTAKENGNGLNILTSELADIKILWNKVVPA